LVLPPRNARGLRFSSLALLVYFTSDFHSFSWSGSGGIPTQVAPRAGGVD